MYGKWHVPKRVRLFSWTHGEVCGIEREFLSKERGVSCMVLVIDGILQTQKESSEVFWFRKGETRSEGNKTIRFT